MFASTILRFRACFIKSDSNHEVFSDETLDERIVAEAHRVEIVHLEKATSASRMIEDRTFGPLGGR